MEEQTQILRTYGQYRAIDTENRTAEFVLSTETEDRHGTVIMMDGWQLENYKNNPIVCHQHRSFSTDPDAIIGTSEIWIENKQLMGRVTFEPADVNPLAEKIFRKVQLGTMRAASVGFYPKKGQWGQSEEDEYTYYFTEVDLVEWSIVSIPSNPDATLKKSADEVQKYLESQAKTKELGLPKYREARHYYFTKYKAKK